MNTKAVAGAVLVVMPAGLAVHRLLMDGDSSIPHGIGYAVFPWLVGVAVGGIKAAFQGLRKKPHDFSNSMMGAAGVVIVLMTVNAFVRG